MDMTDSLRLSGRTNNFLLDKETKIRKAIEIRISPPNENGCQIWTGTYGGVSKYPVLATTLKPISVRRWVYEHSVEDIPKTDREHRFRLEMLCGVHNCLTVEHMTLLAYNEQLSGTKILVFPESDYMILPCDTCGRKCRSRGKYIKGLLKSYNMDDGSRICSYCKRYGPPGATKETTSDLGGYQGSADSLIDDVAWLLNADESPIAVAKRLNFESVNIMYKVLHRLNRADLVDRFKKIGVRL